MSKDNLVQRDGPGRREDDRHKCLFHDFIEDRNLTCFEFIKGNMKKLETRVDGHVDDAHKAMMVHETDQEKTFRGYVSKWVLLVVISIATTAFGIVATLMSNQISDTHKDVKIIGENIHDISNDLVRFRAIQEAVVGNQTRFQNFIDKQSNDK